jgi:hypothetical protein
MAIGGGGHASRTASDRAVRNLMNLKASGSSSRTLNLLSVWEKDHESPEWKTAPFFRNTILNKSIIVKHRLRQDELDLFYEPRNSATKVILPINLVDLRAGGRSFFVGQRGYQAILDELSGDPAGKEHDRDLLAVLDNLPSLDPFLMRERLKKAGHAPARCYFDISEADTAKMFEFTRREITPLIGLTFADVDAAVNEKISKLAQKILNNAGDSELEPLRQGLGLDKPSFEEGIFCWKGFIYYKWSLINLAPTVKPVSDEIAQIRPTGPITEEEKQYILVSRARLTKAIALACDTVRDTLKIYDDAYAELTQCGQPKAFKDFLLDAPHLFHELGERVGAVQHIVSFWRYRFKPGAQHKISGEELFELLTDFEQSLAFTHESGRAAA